MEDGRTGEATETPPDATWSPPPARRERYPRALVTAGIFLFCAGCWTGCLFAGIKSFGATPVEARELEHVNQALNQSIHYRHAADFTPNDTLGDCKTSAATKRARLIAAGWDRRRLDIWFVRDETGAHHAVLVADRSIVLDSRFAWTEPRAVLERYGYRFIAPVTWIDPPTEIAAISPPTAAVTAAK